MAYGSNLFALIPGIRVIGADGMPLPPGLEDSLDALGLESSREPVDDDPDLLDETSPRLYLTRDMHAFVQDMRALPHTGEYLVVDCANGCQSLLSLPGGDKHSGSRHEHILPVEDGISSLCQTFLQRTAGRARASRHFLIGQNLVGASDSFQATLDLTTRISKLDVGVYVFGETGTGKELIARSIHYLSERRDHPFVAINCGAFADELILSELFGHARGAYTGADKSRTGLIEQAEGGTLFLDEIDCMSKKAQIVLLRYLQEKEFRPVGSNKIKSADVRVIAASNTPLEVLVSKKDFRQDLFYRLDILRINLPALRDRGADRQLLSQFFLRRISRELDVPPRVLDSTLLAAIDDYAWPGNIRQLENSIYRVFLLTDGFMVQHSPNVPLYEGQQFKKPARGATAGARKGFQSEKAEAIRRFEYGYLCDVLEHAKGNVSRAARLARKERAAFVRLMRKHDLRREAFVACAD